MSPMAEKNPHQQGRLRSRPVPTPVGKAPVGLRVLGSDDGPTEGYLYLPAGRRAEDPAPLVLLLHGAGEDARDGLAQLRGQAGEAEIVLLALSSRGPTWDSILARGRYGADVAAIDRALGHAFSRCKVDPAHVALAGYSDGASYALSLGLANGDLFSHVLAFSPGFLAPAGQTGSPRVFVSHGTGTGGSRSTTAAAGSSPGYNAPATRYATASSKAATWSRPRSLGRRRPGSPTGAEVVLPYRPRATESLDVGHTPLRIASHLLLRSGAR
jgi:phospholipase/carboxylesterase